MKDPQDITRVRFNLYLSTAQAEQLRRLFAAGLTISGVARMAIRKCCDMQLEPDSDAPLPEKFNLHLDKSDAEILARVAQREGCKKAEGLRRLIHTYLSFDAINQLF